MSSDRYKTVVIVRSTGDVPFAVGVRFPLQQFLLDVAYGNHEVGTQVYIGSERNTVYTIRKVNGRYLCLTPEGKPLRTAKVKWRGLYGAT